jgi:hypothetical protein
MWLDTIVEDRPGRGGRGGEEMTNHESRMIKMRPKMAAGMSLILALAGCGSPAHKNPMEATLIRKRYPDAYVYEVSWKPTGKDTFHIITVPGMERRLIVLDEEHTRIVRDEARE